MKVEVYNNGYYLILKFDRWDQIPMPGDQVFFLYKYTQDSEYMYGDFVVNKRTFHVEQNTWALYVSRI